MKSDSLYCSCCCLCNYTCIDFISHTNRNSCCTDRFLFISTICRCRFHSTIYRGRFRHFKKAISAIIRFFKRVLLEHNHVTQKPQYALLDQNAQVQKARQKSRKDKRFNSDVLRESSDDQIIKGEQDTNEQQEDGDGNEERIESDKKAPVIISGDNVYVVWFNDQNTPNNN